MPMSSKPWASDIPRLNVELADDLTAAQVEYRVGDDAPAVVERARERARSAVLADHRVVDGDLHSGSTAVLEDLPQLVLVANARRRGRRHVVHLELLTVLVVETEQRLDVPPLEAALQEVDVE